MATTVAIVTRLIHGTCDVSRPPAILYDAPMKRAHLIGLSTLVVAIGLGGLAMNGSLHAAPAPQRNATATPVNPLSAVAALKQKQAADAARNAFEDAFARYGSAAIGIDEVATWSRRTYDADPDRGSLATATAYADRARRLEREAQRRIASGSAAKADGLAAAYYRAEAEAVEASAQAGLAPASNFSDPMAYR